MSDQLGFRLSTLDRAASKSADAADKISKCDVGNAILEATYSLTGSRAYDRIRECREIVENKQAAWVAQIREHSDSLKASATNYRVNEEELRKAFSGYDSTPFNRENDTD